jgi:secondary thiamine-phosphate synthase enzyme
MQILFRTGIKVNTARTRDCSPIASKSFSGIGSATSRGRASPLSTHITTSVFINDDKSGLLQDYEKWLEKLTPYEPINQYGHNDTGEDNADAHMKRQSWDVRVVAAVTGGKLDFGLWERFFYSEFDGRRRKRVLVKIIGE